MNLVGLLVRGVVIWAVPLAISFFFYSPQSELLVSYAWFKSVMVVVLTATTLAVNRVRPLRGGSPWVVALAYTAISIVLDLLVLVPFIRMSLETYVEQIALVYSIIFGITLAAHASAGIAHEKGSAMTLQQKSA